MMIEQNTNYAYKLKYMQNPNFDKVRDLAKQFFRDLPEQLQNELHESLKRGVDLLDSEPLMLTYLFSFGKMHQAKLYYAFSKLPEDFLQQDEINIIDYGCGQALGTICYIDFLRELGYSQKIKTITLIEPSELVLKRAALHASVFFPNAEIKTINKTFDDLTSSDIVCSEETPTLHILSNVLDMLSFDLKRFATLIKKNICGFNQFVCVGPYFCNLEKDQRMELFCKMLKGNIFYSKSFSKYELFPDKAWTAQITNFSVEKKFDEYKKKLELAKKGNALAQLELGRLYYMGDGVNKDYKKAIEWFRKAAEQGNAKAQWNLGLCYKNGKGVDKNYGKAVAWSRKAAEQGNASAQFYLGYSYCFGSGIRKDSKKAVEWFKKSAEQEYANAQFSLGVCYINGVGVDKDYEKAVEWFRKAAEQGNASAQFSLGLCYKKGKGVDKNYEKAAEWFRKSAEQGNAEAQFNLGLCYKNGDGVEKDCKKAVEWFRKAAEQGNTNAQYNLGVCDKN